MGVISEEEEEEEEEEKEVEEEEEEVVEMKGGGCRYGIFFSKISVNNMFFSFMLTIAFFMLCCGV